MLVIHDKFVFPKYCVRVVCARVLGLSAASAALLLVSAAADLLILAIVAAASLTALFARRSIS